jgi:hypothetical protein
MLFPRSVDYTFCSEMNDTEEKMMRKTAIGAMLGVVLCQHAILHLAARRFAEIIAAAGLSIALPTPTALLVQRPWLLVFTAAGIIGLSGWAMSKRASLSQAQGTVVALAVIAVALHFFSLIVFLMPWMGGLIGKIE